MLVVVSLVSTAEVVMARSAMVLAPVETNRRPAVDAFAGAVSCRLALTMFS